MSLPYIYSTPSSPDDWRKWSFNHAANHYDWLSAVLDQKDQQLEQFILDPMNVDSLGTWFYWHQTMHDQVNLALGTSGYNLLALDWENEEQFQLWLRENGDEHVRVSAALGVG